MSLMGLKFINFGPPKLSPLPIIIIDNDSRIIVAIRGNRSNVNLSDSQALYFFKLAEQFFSFIVDALEFHWSIQV